MPHGMQGIKGVMEARLDMAVVKGCDGVDPDGMEVCFMSHPHRFLIHASHDSGFYSDGESLAVCSLLGPLSGWVALS